MYSKSKLALAVLPALLLSACNSEDQTTTVDADTVFYNGTVVTMDDEQSVATSVAIKDGVIVALNVDPDEYSTVNTNKVDLSSQTIVPGFIDAHGHLSSVAQTASYANLAPSPIGTSDSIALLVNEMQTFWQDIELADGQWMIGTGYDDSLLAEQTHPTRDDLDQISTEVPIVIIHVSYHLAVVNSKALEVLGITAETEDPDGGKIVRYDDSNEPNGVLEETAMYLAMVAFSSAPQDEQSVLDMYQDTQDYYASFGITTVQDGAAGYETIKYYESLASAEQLMLDVVAFPTWDAYAMMKLDDYSTSKEYDNRFRIGGVKLILDGSPQGKTAFMTQPYLNPPTGESNSYVGYATLTSDFLEVKLSDYLEEGTQFIVHTNGDASVDMYLDALETVTTEETDYSTIRPVSIHSQTTRDDQLERMLTYQMIPSFFSAHTFFWGDWHRDEVFGVERAERISPTRSASNLNIAYTTHNDAPVVDPDMIRLMYNTVNRVTRSGQTLGEEQKATAYEALASMTKNAAYQYFEEDSKGTIEVGKRADLVRLSANPLTIEEDKINTIEVMQTYKDGELIYQQ
ncbi:amidohydrolase [Vibrio hippocampi]|uniref:N-substituted formamide deformylase n=1 Tax=Vibrio hippocampi TaxID=654686 RepID=A0ABN8DHK2_9VIBR|nr:amidohydrolase [Vibrio hippocampi]CAH0526178.1 N-substituted formamide deformylase [Vibrio hippocampi]